MLLLMLRLMIMIMIMIKLMIMIMIMIIIMIMIMIMIMIIMILIIKIIIKLIKIKTKMIIMIIIINFRLELALCLLLAWAIVYGALWKGIKSFGKVIIRTYVHMQGWTKLSPRVCRMKIQHNQSFAIRGETLNYRVFRKNCVFSQLTAPPPSPTSL